ncbi:MAG: hypothetical protein KF754_04395 [Planctomycetes bacterium]|nr:hypothetical protein [Planctomycetota bacterium]
MELVISRPAPKDDHFTASRVEVFGDATGLSADGKTYRLVAPPGVDSMTGALAKPSNMLSNRADNRGCMWLWSGYQYVPPQVGHESGGSTTGAQAGINKLGTYYCWNRTYDVFMGRWTTPDPAATPWGNLWDYVSGVPTGAGDSSGLALPLAGVAAGGAGVITLSRFIAALLAAATALCLLNTECRRRLIREAEKWWELVQEIRRGPGHVEVEEPPPIVVPLPGPKPLPPPFSDAGKGRPYPRVPKPWGNPGPAPCPFPLPDGKPHLDDPVPPGPDNPREFEKCNCTEAKGLCEGNLFKDPKTDCNACYDKCKKNGETILLIDHWPGNQSKRSKAYLDNCPDLKAECPAGVRYNAAVDK